MTTQLATQDYAAYGLAIRSSIPLTEFVAGPAGTEADVTVIRGGALAGFPCGAEGGYVAANRDECRFWFKGIGGFIVKGGAQVTVIPEKSSDESQLRVFIQGMLMAAVLYQRGVCV